MAKRRRTARGVDVRRMAEAMKSDGIDLRYWVSHGTVGTVDDAGNYNFEDPQAVVIESTGVWADVILQPIDVPVTARVQPGIGGGSCTILAPIRPGDEVLVLIPDGNLNNPLTIVAVLNSRTAKLPLESDRKPVFRNDRLSVFAKDVPIEIRTAGQQVRVVSEDIRLGAQDASEQVVKGTSYVADENSMLFEGVPDNLREAFNLLQAAAVGPLAALKPGFLMAMAAIDAFRLSSSTSNNHLSNITRTK